METNIKTEKIIVYAGLILITVFFLYYLYPELKVEHDLNDNLYHYSIAKAMSDQIDNGNNFIDFWLPNYNLGFPLFHYYQFLPSLILNIIYRLFLRNLSLIFLIHASLYLLLSLYPLIIYFSSRKFGFTRMQSLFCSALSLTLSAKTLTYGIELGSYVWRGYGLYTQLIGMFLFPLALAYCYDAIINNKNYFKAILLFAIAFLSHTLVGFTLVYSLILLVISNFFVHSPSKLNESKKRTKRLLIICIAVFALISFFLVPQMLNSSYRFQTKYDGYEKIFSFGAKVILTEFITGNAFDFGRLPLLTILIVIGVISAFFSRKEYNKFMLSGFILWFILYFGKPTLGILVNLIPFASNIQLHRFVFGWDFFALMLASLGLYKLYLFLSHFENMKKYYLNVILILLIILIPLYIDRAVYLKDNGSMIINSNTASVGDEQSIKELSKLINDSNGRVYAGKGTNWGKDFYMGTFQQNLVSQRLSEEFSVVFPYEFSWGGCLDYLMLFNDGAKSHYDLFNIHYAIIPRSFTYPQYYNHVSTIGNYSLFEINTGGYFELVDANLEVHGYSNDPIKYNNVRDIGQKWLNDRIYSNNSYYVIYFDDKKNVVNPGYTSILMLNETNFVYLNETSNSIKPISELNFENASHDICGNIITNKYDGGNVAEAKVKATGVCYLLFKVPYHPNWKLYLDGNNADIVQLSPGFMGVKVDPGIHNIKFEYSMPTIKSYLIIFSLIVFILLICFRNKINI